MSLLYTFWRQREFGLASVSHEQSKRRLKRNLRTKASIFPASKQSSEEKFCSLKRSSGSSPRRTDLSSRITRFASASSGNSGEGRLHERIISLHKRRLEFPNRRNRRSYIRPRLEHSSYRSNLNVFRVTGLTQNPVHTALNTQSQSGYEHARHRAFSAIASDEEEVSELYENFHDSEDYSSEDEPDVKRLKLPTASELDEVYSENCAFAHEDGFPPRRSRFLSTEDGIREQMSRRMPSLFKEHTIDLGQVNKIFASVWLPDERVVMGSKCNKILVYDIRKEKISSVPTLPSNSPDFPEGHHCGIHTISVNPSGTLLATGSYHPADIAIYRLPDLEPVTVGAQCHKDWVFASEWLDDQLLISGSRDGSLGLWKFHLRPVDHIECDHVTWMKSSTGKKFPVTPPLHRKNLIKSDKIRAFACNQRFKTLTSVSLNSYLHVMDLENLYQTRVVKLDNQLTECVCLVTSPDELAFVVGSRCYFSFFDSRCADSLFSVRLPDGPPGGRGLHSSPYYNNFRHGVRSLSWYGDMLTIGTGTAELLFYDVRARDYVQCRQCNDPSHMSVGRQGWHFSTEAFDQFFRDSVPNAVYTHCYDPSKTRLFAAGGPIASSCVGNFASLLS